MRNVHNFASIIACGVLLNARAALFSPLSAGAPLPPTGARNAASHMSATCRRYSCVCVSAQGIGICAFLEGLKFSTTKLFINLKHECNFKQFPAACSNIFTTEAFMGECTSKAHRITTSKMCFLHTALFRNAHVLSIKIPHF